MSDWNTLHFFDDKYFYKKIIYDLSNNGVLLKKYLESELSGNFLFRNIDHDKRVNDILNFCKLLDKDFKEHKTLLNISNRKKKPDEEYSEFINQKNKEEAEFRNQYGQVIEELNGILTLMLFSECASFNPHLILGRKIFTGKVGAKPKSVSEEIISQIMYLQTGIHSMFGSGIMNWITNEELKLLWLDKHNLFAIEADAVDYFDEFLKFIDIAIKNDLGVISGTNMNESILKLAKNSYLDIGLDVKKLGFKSIIRYE